MTHAMTYCRECMGQHPPGNCPSETIRIHVAKATEDYDPGEMRRLAEACRTGETPYCEQPLFEMLLDTENLVAQELVGSMMLCLPWDARQRLKRLLREEHKVLLRKLLDGEPNW